MEGAGGMLPRSCNPGTRATLCALQDPQAAVVAAALDEEAEEGGQGAGGGTVEQPGTATAAAAVAASLGCGLIYWACQAFLELNARQCAGEMRVLVEPPPDGVSDAQQQRQRRRRQARLEDGALLLVQAHHPFASELLLSGTVEGCPERAAARWPGMAHVLRISGAPAGCWPV